MDVLIDGEIVLHGSVGDDIWMDGFTARDVIDALARLGRATDITVRINSGGGIATEGIAIFNALDGHRGKVSVVVEAIAASAASIIAMAGQSVTMKTGALLMIHEPSAITLGTSADHEKSVEMLEAIADSLADVYAEKTGRSRDECRADMREEVWLTADEAVDRGYADTAENSGEPEDTSEPTAFDYRSYRHPPERIAALADANGWTRRTMARQTQSALPVAPANPATIPVETTAPDDIDQVARAAEISQLCAAANMADAAAGFIRDGCSVDDVRQRTGEAAEIRQMVALAHNTNPLISPRLAETWIAARMPPEQVSSEIFNILADLQSPEIMSSHGGGYDAPPSRMGETRVSSEIAASWDRAVAKVNQRNGQENET